MIKIAHMLVTIPCIVAALCFCVQGQLLPTFYSNSCPNLINIVGDETRAAITNDTRMAASLLRLHFHDCFVQGCDASILLDDTSNFTGEKNAGPNNKSVIGYNVINDIKAKVESTCNGVVSCADILALAARDSVVALGGPTWTVSLGRRDSRTANGSAAAVQIPSPAASLSTLLSMFAAKNLSPRDMTALSGAHTIGFARCAVFRNRLYNDANINATFASSLKLNCPNTPGLNDSSLAPLDPTSQLKFDNAYYGNLLLQMGLLHSDQEFFINGGSQDTLVNAYNSNTSLFFTDFAAAMVKMGNINPLTGSNGEIRTNCGKVN